MPAAGRRAVVCAAKSSPVMPSNSARRARIFTKYRIDFFFLGKNKCLVSGPNEFFLDEFGPRALMLSPKYQGIADDLGRTQPKGFVLFKSKLFHVNKGGLPPYDPPGLVSVDVSGGSKGVGP